MSSKAKGVTSLNIREKVKNLLLKVLEQTGGKDQWKVMVVDEHALQVISSACKVSDLLVKNVTIVENLSKKRQPFPTLDAIYFVSPTSDSIDKIIEDYNNPSKPQYANAHLLFSSRLSEELLDKIAKSRLQAKVKTLQDINIDFLAVERPIFTFKQRDDIQRMYGGDQREKERYATQLANQLFTFFLTSGYFPYIRYSGDSNISKNVANKVYDLLAKVVKKKEFNLTTGKSVALIVDRAEDVYAPLLHEFTYQAMTYDLLHVSPYDNIYEYNFVAGDDKEKSKKVLLDEQYDSVWERFRHTHFAELGKELQKEIDAFLDEHKDISNAQKKDVGKKIDTSEISDMIRKLPQYQKSLSLYSMHKQINKGLLNEFRDQSLAKVALEEQNMAVGETPENEKVNAKELLTNITAILSNSIITNENKMRLIMMYIIFNQGKLSDDKKDKLFRMARLSNDEIRTVNNLSYLLKVTKTNLSDRISNFFGRLKGSSTNEKEVGYHLSRYIPKVKEITEKCMTGKLELENYPFVNDPPSTTFKLSTKEGSTTGTSGAGKGTKTSSTSVPSSSSGEDLRSTKKGPTWNKAKKGGGNLTDESSTTTTSSSTSSSSVIENSNKMFVFVIGGATHSETRSAYELMSDHSMDVFLGCTSILTPHVFLEKLGALRPSSSSEYDD
ncbi:hypothetical protein ABK040_006037 [Willaertia magna]